MITQMTYDRELRTRDLIKTDKGIAMLKAIRSYVQMIDNLSIVKETFNDAISYRVVDNSVGYVKGRMPRMVDDLLDVVPRFYTRQELEDLLDD